MSSFVGEKDRKIVPRWRGFRASIGNLQNERLKPDNVISPSLQSNIEDWRRDGSLWTALDVVAGAIVESRLDLAEDALHRIRIDPQTPPAALEIIAEHERNTSFDEPTDLSVVDRCREQIRASRIKLSEYPYDAIEWIDLARSFTTLGSSEKAQKCVAAALTLAPADVFVLRAASRFYIQQRNPERAQWILTKAPRTLGNPWLLASEIAAASVVGRESHLLKVARRMEQADFPNEDLTELRAALATTELDAGSQTKGKKLLRRSLNGANENSLAQIQWMDHTRLGNVIDISTTKPPNRHEAGAWRAYFDGKWDASAAKSILWFEDQPFSANAGIFCSFIFADILGQPEQALSVLKISLRANAENLTLLNNLAFTYIQMDKLDKAGEVLGGIQRVPDNLDHATLEATSGLLAFRQGLPDQGRDYYENAIKTFQRSGGAEFAGRAAVYLALEEVKARTPNSPLAVSRAFELTKDNKRADIAAKIDELQKSAEAWLKDKRKKD